MPDSFTDVAVLVAFLNFAGIAVSAVFSWLASRRAAEAAASSKANTTKLDTVKDKVQRVKDKVEHIETHTNSMQDEMIKSAKKEGIREGLQIAEQQEIKNDDLPPGSKLP